MVDAGRRGAARAAGWSTAGPAPCPRGRNAGGTSTPTGGSAGWAGCPGSGSTARRCSPRRPGCWTAGPTCRASPGWSGSAWCCRTRRPRPAYITSTSSAVSAMTPRSWVMITTAELNSRCRSCSRSRICAWTVTSSAVVGSSAMSSDGSLMRPIAIMRALAHAAGELVREVVDPPVRLRDADAVEHLDGLAARVTLGGARVVHQVGLGQLVADLVERVQGSQRVLEDHRHRVAAQPAHLGLGQAHDLGAGDADRAGDPARLGVVQAEDGQAGDGLARIRTRPRCRGSCPSRRCS